MVDVLSARFASLVLGLSLAAAVPAWAAEYTYKCDLTTACWTGEACEEQPSSFGLWISGDTEDKHAWVDYDSGRYGVFLEQREDNALSFDVSFEGNDGTRTWFGRQNGEVFTMNILPNGEAVYTMFWPDQRKGLTEMGYCILED